MPVFALLLLFVCSYFTTISDITELTIRIDQLIAKQTEMQAEIFRRLDQIDNKQAMLLECVQALAGRSHTNNCDSIKLDSKVKLPKLPLDQSDDLNMLNVHLTDPIYIDQMVILPFF